MPRKLNSHISSRSHLPDPTLLHSKPSKANLKAHRKPSSHQQHHHPNHQHAPPPSPFSRNSLHRPHFNPHLAGRSHLAIRRQAARSATIAGFSGIESTPQTTSMDSLTEGLACFTIGQDSTATSPSIKTTNCGAAAGAVDGAANLTKDKKTPAIRRSDNVYPARHNQPILPTPANNARRSLSSSAAAGVFLYQITFQCMICIPFSAPPVLADN